MQLAETPIDGDVIVDEAEIYLGTVGGVYDGFQLMFSERHERQFGPLWQHCLVYHRQWHSTEDAARKSMRLYLGAFAKYKTGSESWVLCRHDDFEGQPDFGQPFRIDSVRQFFENPLVGYRFVGLFESPTDAIEAIRLYEPNAEQWTVNSIGCSGGNIPKPPRRDLTGQRFGRLTVIALHGRDERGNIQWLCACSCGRTKILLAGPLVGGKTVSCGCHKAGSTLKYARQLQCDLVPQRYDLLGNLTDEQQT